MKSSKRVILNTGILYGRMIITMGISLYSVRLILSGLGVKDYGIFNLLAGIIAMMSFLNAAMSTSTQRFLSYYQGKNDIEMQKKVFSNSLVLHVIIGLLVVATLETLSFFIFDGFLKISPDRIGAAKAVFHFMAATVFFTIVEVPFTGTLNAHENIWWLALVSIFEVLLKLGAALLILFKLNTDKLILYGTFNPCITVVSTVLYASFCLVKYKECTLRIWSRVEQKLLKELASFAGWNLFGSLCVLAKNQGIAVILNVFFGTVVNAAYGVANQVAAQLNFLSFTLMQAMNPQIMKSHSAGDSERMLRLSMIASKFSFFLMAMFAVPFMFEMNGILTVWLKEVPKYTVIFCNLILMSALINQLTIGLQSAMQATGKIKVYQMIVGTLILLNIPIGYLFLRLGFPPYMALYSFSIIEIMACVFRLYLARRIAGLNIGQFISKVLVKEAVPLGLMILCCFCSIHFFDFKYRFFFTIIVSSVCFVVSIYHFGLYNDELIIIQTIFERILEKVGLRKYFKLE